MLTCEEIAERARAISAVIDRENYRSVATQIHLKTARPERSIADDNLPELEEYRGRTHTNTEDWTDMVVALVLLWQLYAAWRRETHEPHRL